MFYTPTDEARLAKLLHLYNEQPDQRDELTAQIQREFQQTVGILVLDTCSFSRSVRSAGVVHLLALLERLARLIVPQIEAAGGKLLRREADNLFAIFPDVASTLTAATSIVRDVRTVNGPLPARDEMYIALGVGYGSVLIVGSHDLFGDEMNLACKLGEDLAQQSEILLTSAAYEALDATIWPCEELQFSVSGIDIMTYRLMMDND